MLYKLHQVKRKFKCQTDLISKQFLFVRDLRLPLRSKIITALYNDVRYQNEICAVLGLYAVSNGSSVPTFRDKLLVKNLYFVDRASCNDSW